MNAKSDDFTDVYDAFMERYDIGTIPVGESYNGRAGLYPDNPGMHLRDFPNAENVPVKFVNPLQLKRLIADAKRKTDASAKG